MKKNVLTLLAGLTMSAAQAANYGVVDYEKLMLSSTYLQSQQASLDQAIKAPSAQAQQLQKDLAAIQQKADTEKLSEAEKNKMSADFQKKVAQLNALQQEIQTKAQTTMQATKTTFETRVATAAEQLRKENKLDLVLNKSAVLASESNADLTDKLIQKVNAVK